MPKKKPAPKKSTEVKSHRHRDTRKNIPTEELRDFVRDDEDAPQTMLYPRDPSLDPQLVWKGKDEQDRADLAVPVVPIYIQEKIHPQAIIDDLKRTTADGKPGDRQLGFDFFSDFNGLPDDFSDRIDFYQHDGHWQNRMILGDSLLVMTSLAEKGGLKGKVQTIYLDPPYGIKFGSNWQVSTRKRNVEEKAQDATRQPEQIRAFRDTWQLGIHSYLAYLRDRLTVTRALLTETGSVLVQIGDENVHLVRNVLDEVFGSENFCSLITFAKTTGATATTLPTTSDYILFYAKNIKEVKYRKLYERQTAGEAGALEYKRVELADGSLHPISKFSVEGEISLPNGARIFATGDISSKGGDDPDIELIWEGKKFVLSCKPNRHWKAGVPGTRALWSAGRLLRQVGLRIYKRYFDDFPYRELVHVWTDTRGEPDPNYVVQTSAKVIERCILMTTDPGDLVLDPTCGSGTTAYVAEQWGRRWITCDTSRVALALARTRLMAAKFPYFILAAEVDSGQWIVDSDGKPYRANHKPLPTHHSPDLRRGFVYKRVPHVTLKSIANNPDIKEGMTREQIDAAISKHAETETLFDQPYEDNKTVRVTGPFTVESLSPHRTISVEEKKHQSEVGRDGWKTTFIGPTDFTAMIIENLRKAGVQNTVKGERLKFDTLAPFAGQWIHAEGRYTEKDGTEKRAAICIGPEYGTVGAQLVKEAAKEAVKGVGFDVLIVCGFAFDPSVSEEAKRYGKLVVLPARMNPDLAMGDELLKKTGAGNLFMVFGEPDVEIRNVKLNGNGKAKGSKPSKPAPGDQIVVEIKGVDVYDPTTGDVRSSSTDDIACWFIDTAYNGESFFVRHAYFTGNEQPYDKLKRALKAEIDEAAWSSLYATESRPFARPESGKIAVKVINHYGDEVLKVFEV